MMPVGKVAAQVAHASMAFMTSALRSVNQEPDPYSNEMWHAINDGYTVRPPDRKFRSLEVDEELAYWLDGSFTKAVVAVQSEVELIEIFAKAKMAGLRHSLITDEGRTVFNGVPTHTCVAIGPNYIERVNAVARHLPLYR
jgi:PTH2 family peptidyl-tRNA hydrolase